MASSAGDILRDDECKFMDVPKNYHVFTESNQLTMSKFNKKIFYPYEDDKNLNLLFAHVCENNIVKFELINMNQIMNNYNINNKIKWLSKKQMWRKLGRRAEKGAQSR